MGQKRGDTVTDGQKDNCITVGSENQQFSLETYDIYYMVEPHGFTCLILLNFRTKYWLSFRDDCFGGETVECSEKS